MDQVEFFETGWTNTSRFEAVVQIAVPPEIADLARALAERDYVFECSEIPGGMYYLSVYGDFGEGMIADDIVHWICANETGHIQAAVNAMIREAHRLVFDAPEELRAKGEYLWV